MFLRQSCVSSGCLMHDESERERDRMEDLFASNREVLRGHLWTILRNTVARGVRLINFISYACNWPQRTFISMLWGLCCLDGGPFCIQQRSFERTPVNCKRFYVTLLLVVSDRGGGVHYHFIETYSIKKYIVASRCRRLKFSSRKKCFFRGQLCCLDITFRRCKPCDKERSMIPYFETNSH